SFINDTIQKGIGNIAGLIMFLLILTMFSGAASLNADINGLPQAILVTRANVSDRSGALAMFSLDSQNLELVQHVMVDGGYTGNDFADQVKLILNAKTTVAKRNELHMFTVLPQRWIVERSWSWLDKCRRLWKNCERALNSSLQMVVLAFLKIVLKRY
ncbi:transposase, partial [Oenococcus oeni]|uniref:transposase n=1 Tax=Oenococcus oeni TaxID=1247 RepID=UPI00214B6D1E